MAVTTPQHGLADDSAGAAGGELSQIIQAYNEVTEKLRVSHEKLSGEVVRLRKQLASADAALQRSKRLAALGEMAAGIAHEIRNPLGAIQLYAQLIEQDLQEGIAGDQTEDTVRKISRAVRGLDAIVGDVLSFARPMEPERRVIPAEGLFQRVLDSNRHGLERERVSVTLAGVDTPVPGDARLIEQAMINLVRNAIDAVAESPRRELVLSAAVKGESVELMVRDTGPGIEDDAIDRIFNPFFTTRSTGTGLGLAIVHRIADAHGGSVVVHNDPVQGGAVFCMTLPQVGHREVGETDEYQGAVGHSRGKQELTV